MKFSHKLGPTPSLVNVPGDVLTRITLHTVSLSSSTPTPRELITVPSLLLTCRVVEQELSFRNNPHLYANIFRLLFDVEAVERRMGAGAVTSSALASELRPRVETLKRLKAGLDSEGSGSDVTSSDLTRIFLMMTENEGKNGHQLSNFVNLSRIPDLLFAHPSRIRSSAEDIGQNTGVTLILAMMWIDALIDEYPERRAAILECLQPLVLETNSRPQSPISLYGTPSDRGSVPNPQYFTIPCRFRLPSASPFARVCTAGRYNVANELRRERSGGQYLPESSTRFDDDWSRYLTIDQSTPGGGRIQSLLGPAYSAGTAEGLWEGGWFIPCVVTPTQDITTYTRAMQFHIREYVSFSSQDSVSFVSGKGCDGDELARAWFPEGAEFDETLSSLRIYDPTKRRWLCYKPHSNIVELSGDGNQRQVAFDTILVGHTDASHGAAHDEYVFHGRVRPEDGHISLVRNPSNPTSDQHGTWVFHGQILGKGDFVGDWKVTSTADHVASGRGWFHVAKVGARSVFQ